MIKFEDGTSGYVVLISEDHGYAARISIAPEDVPKLLKLLPEATARAREMRLQYMRAEIDKTRQLLHAQELDYHKLQEKK